MAICEDCGTTISYGCRWCIRCAGVRRRKPIPTCCECGRRLSSRRTTICRNCNATKQCEFLKGQEFTATHRHNIALANTGRKHSEATKEKLSASHCLRPCPTIPTASPQLARSWIPIHSVAASSNQTIIPASSAAEPGEGSLFTISKIAPQGLEASGRIATVTSKPFAPILSPRLHMPRVTTSLVANAATTLFAGTNLRSCVCSPACRRQRRNRQQARPAALHGTPNTFWHASKQILQQVFNVLRPGVSPYGSLKTYVRDGEIVPFSQQWKTLCEHVGFVTLHEHPALLVERHGTQRQLFGEADTEHQTARKSFFRRMYENAHPENAINLERFVACGRRESSMAHVLLVQANSLHRPLKDQSVHCCITSPPYYGLRDYGTGEWHGGEVGCDHRPPPGRFR